MAIVSAGVWLLAGVAARQALTVGRADWRMPEYPAAPPARHPYLIMNPWSGGGKVGRFDLKRKAEALGAEVFVFGGSGPVDVAAVARQAVADGADLLTCTIWPGALRVWVPRDRPGIPAPAPAVNWARLRRLAGGRREPAEVTR